MITIKKVLAVIKYILVLASFVFVFLVFNWWGIVGYVVFIMLVAGYILYNKWDSYQAITSYGANELRKVIKGDNKRTVKKTSSTLQRNR